MNTTSIPLDQFADYWKSRHPAVTIDDITLDHEATEAYHRLIALARLEWHHPGTLSKWTYGVPSPVVTGLSYNYEIENLEDRQLDYDRRRAETILGIMRQFGTVTKEYNYRDDLTLKVDTVYGTGLAATFYGYCTQEPTGEYEEVEVEVPVSDETKTVIEKRPITKKVCAPVRVHE